jgi:hypothetical protein
MISLEYYLSGLYCNTTTVCGPGGAADMDLDGDGIRDGIDNCIIYQNPEQADADADGIGDVCDPDSPTTPDSDGDGVFDASDRCPGSDDRIDSDQDGTPDACDETPLPDPDGDGIGDEPGELDNCPNESNREQFDEDRDGTGDRCDSDIDNDGRPNTSDNCPELYNPDQRDNDRDGIGNACENAGNSNPKVPLRYQTTSECPYGVRFPYYDHILGERGYGCLDAATDGANAVSSEG